MYKRKPEFYQNKFMSNLLSKLENFVWGFSEIKDIETKPIYLCVSNEERGFGTIWGFSWIWVNAPVPGVMDHTIAQVDFTLFFSQRLWSGGIYQ